MRADLSMGWSALARRDANLALQAEIMARHDGQPLGIEFRHREGNRWACILPNVSGGPAFKLQFFDALSFTGHLLYGALSAALEQMLVLGYREEDAGALDRASATERWAQGLHYLALAQQSPGVFLRKEA